MNEWIQAWIGLFSEFLLHLPSIDAEMRAVGEDVEEDREKDPDQRISVLYESKFEGQDLLVGNVTGCWENWRS